MRFILISLVFYLLVEAYYAAVRVARKRQLAKDSSQSSLTRTNAAQPSAAAQPQSEVINPSIVGSVSSSQPETLETSVSETVAPKSSSEVSAPMAHETAAPEMREPGSAASENSNNIASEPSSPVLPIGSPVIFDPDKDLTLAVSLSVTDIVHPESSGAVEVPDLIPTDPAISEVLNANGKLQHGHQPSILEEIAELRPIADAQQSSEDDRTSRFIHALQTGDGTVRVAAVFELGEIAAQRQGRESEQIIEQLQQLTQDEDPDVRMQAIAALAKVQG